MKRLLPILLSGAMAISASAGETVEKKLRDVSSPAPAVVSKTAAMPTTMTITLNGSYEPGEDSVADYYMLFTDNKDAKWSKEDGPQLKDGFVLRLDCYAPLSEQPITLPSGTYKPSDEYSSMTYAPEYSYVEYYDANGNVAGEYDLTGDVTVKTSALSGYIITVNVDGYGSLKFSGQINFEDATLPPSVFTQIKQNLDWTFNGALAFYDGNLFQSNTGSLYINLYDCAFDESTGGMLEDGHSFALQLFGKLFSDTKNIAPDPGTYTMGRDFKRYTWYPGTELEYMGMVGLMGCYAKERNLQLYDGIAYSYLTDGTIEVESLGADVYRITVDCTTNYGHTVKGKFEGKIPIIDQSDDSKGSSLSTLEDDVILDLDKIPVCRTYNAGVVNGCQTFLVDIGSPSGKDNLTEGDIMRIEVVLPEGTQYVQEGTYTVMTEKYETYYSPYKLGRGRWVSAAGGGTDLSGTRYMHFEEGRYLIMDHYAPAAEGTVGVTKNADNTWTFNIHLIDDAQFKIDGDWTGPMELMYDPNGITAIEGIGADNTGMEWIDNNTICITGTEDASGAAVYNLHGMRVNATISGNIVSLAGLPSGIHIIKFQNNVLKIAKR